ncbi:hypothetical protein MRB53_032597 [Persea americana]|uniref:Uncharacterized protein n=1 Tax=Persea americana TaxID=3435 RepID=A0ACC2KSN2_PERAE|nr:hypothetical protein MRB53_032597 [Persea americana]
MGKKHPFPFFRKSSRLRSPKISVSQGEEAPFLPQEFPCISLDFLDEEEIRSSRFDLISKLDHPGRGASFYVSTVRKEATRPSSVVRYFPPPKQKHQIKSNLGSERSIDRYFPPTGRGEENNSPSSKRVYKSFQWRSRKSQSPKGKKLPKSSQGRSPNLNLTTEISSLFLYFERVPD